MFFRIITRQVIRRAFLRSVELLVPALTAFSIGWNDRFHQVTWTKTADASGPTQTVNGVQTRDARSSL